MAKKIEFEATRGDLYRMHPNDLTIIGLDTKDGPSHPLYDPRIKLPPDEVSVKYIAEGGVVPPILVRHNGAKVVEVVDGRRRTINTRVANILRKKMKLPDVELRVVFEKDDDVGFLETMIGSNEHGRQDDMITKAEKALRLSKAGCSEERIATVMNMSVQMVKLTMKLLDLSSGVQSAVRKGLISASAAVNLAKLPREEQDAALKQLMAEAGSSGSAANAKSGRVTTESARRAVNLGPSNYAIPKKRQLSRLITEYEAGKHQEVDELVIKVVRCLILGNLNPRGIKGMSEALRQTEKKPKTKAEADSEPVILVSEDDSAGVGEEE